MPNTLTTPTLLNPEQLAERWQISKSKVYQYNNEGLLPHLKIDHNKFPLIDIENLEHDPEFNVRDICTPLERRQKKQLNELNEQLKLKDNEISELKAAIAKAQSFLTEVVFVQMNMLKKAT